MRPNPTPTKIVNLYKEKYDVYIGRTGQGQSGYFGNPFKVNFSTSREEALEAFKKYFYDRLQSDPEFKMKVLQLKGKTLGCFCKPNPCHGDIIAGYLNSLHPIKLAIVGSRSFNDYEFMCEILQWYDIKAIISGGAKGADNLAAKYAKVNNIPLKEFIPEWDKYGKSAGYKRNIKIVEAADEVIAFWDGQSKGTQHSINIAHEQSKPVAIFWPQKNLGMNDEFTKLGL